MTPKIFHRQQFWLATLLIMLIAALLRFHHLADLPRGLFFDPAINGLDAIRLAQRGGHTLFFPSNGGRESLFIYMLIPYIELFGSTPFAMRLLTVSLSLLTLAALLSLSRRAPALPTLPLFAGLTLAVSYWHLSVSRLGQRPIMVPLLATLTFWLILRARQTADYRPYIAAGFITGIGLYNYSAARLIPLILLLALLPDLRLRLRRQSVAAMGAFLLPALLIALPMLSYFWRYPSQFTARAGSVTVWSFLHTPPEIAMELARNALRVGGFFGYAGSPNPLFGLPEHPGLSPLLTPFLLLGLAVSFAHGRQFFYRLTLLWWLVGLLPSVIAIEAPHPLRMIVALVPTALLVGIGCSWLYQQNRPNRLKRLMLVILIALPLLTLPGTYRAYFVTWPTLSSTQGAYDYGAATIYDYIATQPPTETPLYLPASRANDSTLLYYLSGKFSRAATLTVPQTAQIRLLSPPEHEQTRTWIRLYQNRLTILPPLTQSGQAMVAAAFTPKTLRRLQTERGETVARLATITQGDLAAHLQQPTHPLTATFGPLSLFAAHYTPTLDPRPVEPLPITLYWRAHQQTATEYETLLRLVNDQQQALGNGDARPHDWLYPTSFWRPHDDEIAVPHQINMLTTEPLPPGRYWLAVSVLDPLQQRRLPLTTGRTTAPDTTFIGPLKVPLPPPATWPANHHIATFAETITLRHVQHQRTISPGETLLLDLYWQALETPPQDYTLFLHLLDLSGNRVAGHDRQPFAGRYPTTIWDPGERLHDQHPLPLPADLPPGQYQIALGLYHQPSGHRLPLTDPAHPAARLILEPPLTVE